MGTLAHNIGIFITAGICAASFSGCIYEEMKPCGPAEVLLEPDWALSPGASPDGMAYCFYPSDGGAPWRFDFSGREGGRITLPEGTYGLIAFNDDTSGVLFSGLDSYSDAEVYSREVTLMHSPGQPDATTPQPPSSGHLDPDIMWTASCTPIEVTAGCVVRCEPRQLTPRINVEIQGIKNMSSAKTYGAMLAGLSESVTLSNSRTEGSTTMPFTVNPQGSDKLAGSFYCFGTSSDRQMLTLFVIMSDGNRIRYTYDVHEQIASAPDSMDIDIIVPGPSLPDTGESDNDTFDVEVDGWHTIHIYY